MIIFQTVSKSYSKEIGAPSHTALANLSFTVHKGETLGLIGANGAGKSTSIRLLMDFIRPDTGTIQLFNSSPRTPQLRQQIGYLPEVANFPANLTVLDLLGFTGTTCAVPKDILQQRAHELLTLLDLWQVRRRPLRSYSKGMQQRANFAIALINDPELLILDEPMSGLDPMGRKKIIDLIGQLKEAGKTILFCSHILEDVDRLVDSVLLLHKGKKLFHGPPDVLAADENQASMAEAFVSRVKREEAHV
ncbi:MAG: ABC transporter ATP-binding protein [Desulfocapsaceae bacterium]|nr:ABC transporter ATP-binding protein [Desulfocapsaceae bacterium]